MSKKTNWWRSILTIFLLILIFPIGLIVMWRVSHWNKKIMWVISLVVLIFGVYYVRNLSMFTERFKIDSEWNKCNIRCQENYGLGKNECTDECRVPIEEFNQKWGIKTN